MATGKTTLGRAVAMCLKWSFIDLDQLIEQDTGMRVSDIFRLHGEAHFRALERETLQHVASMPGKMIIACGGGTPCHADNMDLMNASGLTVLLEAPIPRLIERLRLTPGQRPLIDNLSEASIQEYVTTNLKARDPFYSRAHYRFDSSQLEDTDQIKKSAQSFINMTVNQL